MSGAVRSCQQGAVHELRQVAGQATLCIADNAVGLINRVNSGFTSQPEWMARLARKGSTARPPLWMSAERPIFLTRGRVRLNGWRLLLITKEEVAWARIPHRAEEVVPPLRSAGFTIYRCVRRATTSVFTLAEDAVRPDLQSVLERDVVGYEVA